MLLLAGVAAGQTGETRPEWKAFYARQTEFQRRGTEALERERARQKRGLCQTAGSTVALDNCVGRELKVTQANYVAYELALGGLLRLGSPGDDARAEAGKNFDAGERAWAEFRDKTCQELYGTYGRGTGAAPAWTSCRITLTASHMNDLSAIYEMLWK